MSALIASPGTASYRSSVTQTYIAQASVVGEKHSCPYCNSLVWVRVRRTWWQKLLHPHQNHCYCRLCRQLFWKDT